MSDKSTFEYIKSLEEQVLNLSVKINLLEAEIKRLRDHNEAESFRDNAKARNDQRLKDIEDMSPK